MDNASLRENDLVFYTITTNLLGFVTEAEGQTKKIDSQVENYFPGINSYLDSPAWAEDTQNLKSAKSAQFHNVTWLHWSLIEC